MAVNVLHFRTIAFISFFFLHSLSDFAFAQDIPYQPFSTLANAGCEPCKDTLKFLFIKRVYDIGLLIPEWKPVVNPHYVAVLEGEVVRPPGKYNSGHVSPVDYSAYHYTHDFGFDVQPDSAYTGVLARRVYSGMEQEVVDPVQGKVMLRQGQPDTVLQTTIHVEWESGLGAGNKGNPCTQANCAGNSGGFFSGGHRAREALWNWPTIGDWVHLEGQWIWDRGHPPARTEIHPIRFCAVRRHLPDRIVVAEAQVFATRIDIFASGDGGALNNNRAEQPGFVLPVHMSDKDYAVQVRPVLPRPSAKAQLRYRIIKRAGDNHPIPLEIQIVNSGGETALDIHLPWKGQADTLLCARSIYMWWDEGNGLAEDYKIFTYQIHFQQLRFHQRKEFSSRSEYRMFFEVGGQWFFLNEFETVSDILHGGHGKTYHKHWKMGQTLLVHVPQDQQFRVHLGGW
ncbi:MAG TPA: hypothetical protein ENJ82_05780, partial [Bacteroidetes bacterium]|nr:hypothetical protein [Bacteroidota bacterium]